MWNQRQVSHFSTNDASLQRTMACTPCLPYAFLLVPIVKKNCGTLHVYQHVYTGKTYNKTKCVPKVLFLHSAPQEKTKNHFFPIILCIYSVTVHNTGTS